MKILEYLAFIILAGVLIFILLSYLDKEDEQIFQTFLPDTTPEWDVNVPVGEYK